MWDRFRRLTLPPSQASDSASNHSAADDYSWLFPPNTVTDAAAWDSHWVEYVKRGAAGLVEMFCSDGELVDAMSACELRSVLCVGSGISQEPRALCAAGFDVTALDLSAAACTFVMGAVAAPDHLARILDGRPFNAGGSLNFVTGDLRATTLCPGPFDVIIERRTLQLFPPGERVQAIEGVANRLASRGIFFSHGHDGGWKPGKERNHPTAAWFVDRGWPRWQGEIPLTHRVGWPFFSTG